MSRETVFYFTDEKGDGWGGVFIFILYMGRTGTGRFGDSGIWGLGQLGIASHVTWLIYTRVHFSRVVKHSGQPARWPERHKYGMSRTVFLS